jgi:hypothetical protein
MLKKEDYLKDFYIKIPLSEIQKLFKIFAISCFISYNFGKAK